MRYTKKMMSMLHAMHFYQQLIFMKTIAPSKGFFVNQKSNDKPCIENGLTNACRKKNNLYRGFLKCRSNDTERR